jgi:hypothetical protein
MHDSGEARVGLATSSHLIIAIAGRINTPSDERAGLWPIAPSSVKSRVRGKLEFRNSNLESLGSRNLDVIQGAPAVFVTIEEASHDNDWPGYVERSRVPRIGSRSIV